MRRYLFLLTLLLGWSAGAQSPEELYEEYITPETRAVLERFEQAEREVQAAEAAARARKTLMLAVAVLIGLIPVVVTGRRVLREKTWKDNPGGTALALGASLAGGLVLFGLNYGVHHPGLFDSGGAHCRQHLYASKKRRQLIRSAH